MEELRRAQDSKCTEGHRGDAQLRKQEKRLRQGTQPQSQLLEGNQLRCL